MVPIHRPKNSEIHRFQKEPRPIPATTASAKNTMANFSIGLIAEIAQRAIGAVPIIITMQDSVPPIAEAVMARPTALPAWPFLTIGWPSKVVGVFSTDPGILNRIAVVAPP